MDRFYLIVADAETYRAGGRVHLAGSLWRRCWDRTDRLLRPLRSRSGLLTAELVHLDTGRTAVLKKIAVRSANLFAASVGLPSDLAIKCYTAYAFHRWVEPLAFLCLIGDASEDHRGIEGASNPDFVPSHSLYAPYEGAPEESDQYYAEVTRGGAGSPGDPFDDLADIYVGRLAVGTTEEFAWNLNRIRPIHWSRSVTPHNTSPHGSSPFGLPRNLPAASSWVPRTLWEMAEKT